MTENDLTFEGLTEIYRNEKKYQALSDVRKDLYPSLIRLRETARKDYEAKCSEDPDSIICEGLNERRKNVARHVMSIIDLRMEKIAKMALLTSMGAEDITEKLTPEEKEYYRSVVDGSKKLRALTKDGKGYTVKDITSADADKKENILSDAPKDVVNVAEERTERMTENPDDETDMITVRILDDVPEIAGLDRDHSFRKGEVVRIPAVTANVLINHKAATILEITP